MTVNEACNLRDEIAEICEDVDTSEFLEDIMEKSASVCETVERTKRVTEKQEAALTNWAAAARKFRR